MKSNARNGASDLLNIPNNKAVVGNYIPNAAQSFI